MNIHSQSLEQRMRGEAKTDSNRQGWWGTDGPITAISSRLFVVKEEEDGAYTCTKMLPEGSGVDTGDIYCLSGVLVVLCIRGGAVSV